VGLGPLILEKSFGAQFMVPMAVSLAFGVVFATFITLILVPTAYLILDDLTRGARWLFGRGDIEEDDERFLPSPVAPALSPAETVAASQLVEGV
jgi:hypothetical protein